MFSTNTVLPSKFKIIPSYSLSVFISFAAIPITPWVPFVISLSIFLPFTDDIGKNDALPKLFCLRYSINFFASSSVSVTIFWSVCPSTVSIANWYSFETVIRFAKTPLTPLFSLLFFSHSISIDFTALEYPSFSFSISLKNFCLESFILNSDVKLFIFSSYSAIFKFASSLFTFIVSNLCLQSFLFVSFSLNVFSKSDFIILFSSSFDIVSWISFFIVFSRLFKFSLFISIVFIFSLFSYLTSVFFSTFFFFSSIFFSSSVSLLDNSFSFVSFSSSSFANFSLFAIRLSFLFILFSFSSFISSFRFCNSSISLTYVSWFCVLFAIFSFCTLISELICSIFFSLSKLKFCVSSIFDIVFSSSCFRFSFKVCKVIRLFSCSAFWEFTISISLISSSNLAL